MIETERGINSLPREERLRGRGAVSQLFGEGEGGFVYPIRYVWRKVTNEGANEVKVSSNSVLFTVPKRFHKRANRRNLLRRRIKEAYRLQKGLLQCSSLNIALIYSTKEAMDYDKIYRSVGKILTQIDAECKK